MPSASKRPVYIFGHRNPDADAICSALAYADFKRRTTEGTYQPARCGNTNARIDAILSLFQVEPPPFIGDVTPRLRDHMSEAPAVLGPRDTCARALALMDEHDVQVVPVVDGKGRLEGLVSIFQMGAYFVPQVGSGQDIRRVDTSLQSIVDALGAEPLHLEDADTVRTLYVRVGAMQLDTFMEYQENGELPPNSWVLVVGDRRDIQLEAIRRGVHLLVVTGGRSVDPDVVEAAREAGTSLVVSPRETATTAWTIRAAVPVSRVMDSEPETFGPDETVESVRRRTNELGQSVFAVTDEGRRLLGLFTHRDLLRPSPVRLILVDHNEMAQAVEGAGQVQVEEVIDHHRLGDLRTEGPILFLNRPVGSTCTIVADLYRQAGLQPTRAIAGVLMGGLVSDTLNLRSPTTTDLDREILAWLEERTGVTGEELAEHTFRSGSFVAAHEPAEVLQLDRKAYEEDGVRFAISQVEELGFDEFWKRASDLGDAL
ncbi:MAG: putative manganese-dependent inorganic diphosphatase, partial [Gemmatimonadales bacterium]